MICLVLSTIKANGDHGSEQENNKAGKGRKLHRSLKCYCAEVVKVHLS